MCKVGVYHMFYSINACVKLSGSASSNSGGSGLASSHQESNKGQSPPSAWTCFHAVNRTMMMQIKSLQVFQRYANRKWQSKKNLRAECIWLWFSSSDSQWFHCSGSCAADWLNFLYSLSIPGAHPASSPGLTWAKGEGQCRRCAQHVQHRATRKNCTGISWFRGGHTLPYWLYVDITILHTYSAQLCAYKSVTKLLVRFHAMHKLGSSPIL